LIDDEVELRNILINNDEGVDNIQWEHQQVKLYMKV
jgi:hypothetical protein